MQAASLTCISKHAKNIEVWLLWLHSQVLSNDNAPWLPCVLLHRQTAQRTLSTCRYWKNGLLISWLTTSHSLCTSRLVWMPYRETG